VRALLVYLALGVALQLVIQFGTISGDLRRAKWAERGITRTEIHWLLMAVAIWPAVLAAMVLVRLGLLARWHDKMASAFRRDYIDRDGLLDPQMPGPRFWLGCPVCGAIGRDRVRCECPPMPALAVPDEIVDPILRPCHVCGAEAGHLCKNDAGQRIIALHWRRAGLATGPRS